MINLPSIAYTMFPMSPSLIIKLSLANSTGYMQLTILSIWSSSKFFMKSFSKMAVLINSLVLKRKKNKKHNITWLDKWRIFQIRKNSNVWLKSKYYFSLFLYSVNTALRSLVLLYFSWAGSAEMAILFDFNKFVYGNVFICLIDSR